MPELTSRRLLPAVLFACALTSASGHEIDTRHAEFATFESGPVNSLLLTRDGSRLLVLNTTDHRVEIFRLPSTVSKYVGASSTTTGGSGSLAKPGSPASLLSFEFAIFTGIEPIALVAHPTADRVFFVSNHGGDTVAVIDLELRSVIATLPVGDEPTGLAIGGGKLFVACSRTPQAVPSVGAVALGVQDENVVVMTSIDPPYSILGHVGVGGMKPRDVVTANGRAYVAIGVSGNHTTLLDESETKQLGLEQTTSDGYDTPFAINPVLTKPELNPLNFARGWYVPNAGRIVFDSEYPTLVPQLADRDVVALDAGTGALTPFLATGVGTNLYAIAHDATSNRLWVTNTDARNRTRFEPRLRGRAVANRITLVDSAGAIAKVIELDSATLGSPAALPGAIAFSANRAFVAAQGSDCVLVFDKTSAQFVRRVATGSIPSGIAIDPQRGALFVHARGAHSVAAFDLDRFAPLGATTRLSYDPEPPLVRQGRAHLYSANANDGHGNGSVACASCHVFGHGDGLAWDLGDPEGGLSYYFPDVLKGLGSYPDQVVVLPTTGVIHPLKGPMVTQSLRGLMDPATKDDLPLHWRGDRRTFHQFRSAFESLLDGDGVDMSRVQEFAGFLRHLRYAPNPLEPRDRVYTGMPAAGADKFGMNLAFSGQDYSAAVGVSCIDCHNGDFFERDDFTGSRPVASAGSFTQLFQTAQLRMAYEKHSRALTGFGLLHDGAVDGVRGFLVDFKIPNGGSSPFHALNLQDKEEIASFVERFDHGLSPLVGAQFTLNPATLAQSLAFLDLAEAQAKPNGALAPSTDLILKGYRIAPDGKLLLRGALFTFDMATQSWGYRFDTGDFIDRLTLLLVVQSYPTSFTFTCVPPGTGERLGIDRDEDGAYDSIEAKYGLDPTRPDSDGDGFADGVELASHTHPLVPGEFPFDATPPQFESLRTLEIGAESATLTITTNEPTHLTLALGTTPGASDIATYDTGTLLRRRHDRIAADLPSGIVLYATLTATDRSGNMAVTNTSFTTLAPFFHLDSITLEKSATAPYAVTARVRVVDRKAQPIANLPLVVFFAGDLGGQAWQRGGTTDGSGLASIVVSGLAPGAPTTIAVSVAWLGSTNSAHPYFVGAGGQTPNFYYDVTENRAHYATIALP